MEQYEIPPRIYFQTLQKILKHFKPELAFVRFVGSLGGKVVVRENLQDKALAIKKAKGGIKIFIDGTERFFYEMTSFKKYGSISGKAWTIAYERVHNDGRYHSACSGYPNSQEPYTGPDDPTLPTARKSILRSANYTHLVEITFPGKIPLRRLHQISDIPDWYYWAVDLQ